jgi:hypothetical protein
VLAWIGSAVGMDSGAPKAGGRKGSPAPTYLPLGAPPGRYGYTPLVWTVVMLNAFGGLCVAVVVKYASRACAGRPLARCALRCLSCGAPGVCGRTLQTNVHFLHGACRGQRCPATRRALRLAPVNVCMCPVVPCARICVSGGLRGVESFANVSVTRSCCVAKSFATSVSVVLSCAI